MDRSTFGGTVGSSTKYKGPGRALPLMSQANRQTDLSSGCGPCSGLCLAPALLGCRLEAHGKYNLSLSPMVREPLWKPRFPVEEFQHNIGAKSYEIGGTGEGKDNGLTLPATPLTQAAQLRTRIFSACDLSCEGEMRAGV